MSRANHQPRRSSRQGPPPVYAPVDPNRPMELDDGTPVEYNRSVVAPDVIAVFFAGPPSRAHRKRRDTGIYADVVSWHFERDTGLFAGDNADENWYHILRNVKLPAAPDMLRRKRKITL